MRQAILVALALVLTFGEVRACTCDESARIGAQFRNATAVFTGAVVAIRDSVQRAPDGRLINIEFLRMVEVRVDRAWKGTRADTTVTVTTEGGMCATPFRLHEAYVVYAVRRMDRPDWFVTDACRRSMPLVRARADLDSLGPPRWRAHSRK